MDQPKRQLKFNFELGLAAYDQFFATDEVSDPTQCCEGTAQSRNFGNAMKTAAGISKKYF
jgi:hypothetical protein